MGEGSGELVKTIDPSVSWARAGRGGPARVACIAIKAQSWREPAGAGSRGAELGVTTRRAWELVRASSSCVAQRH